MKWIGIDKSKQTFPSPSAHPLLKQPEQIVPTTSASTMGIVSMPDFTVVIPRTPWNHSGRVCSMEISPPPTHMAKMIPLTIMRWLKM